MVICQGLPSGNSHFPLLSFLNPLLVNNLVASAGSYFHQPTPKTVDSLQRLDNLPAGVDIEIRLSS